MDLKPVYDKVLVLPDPKEEKTSGGIVLPSDTSAEDSPATGKVVAVGEGRLTKSGNIVPLVVKEGDRIMYTPWADGQTVTDNGVKYVILSEEHILAII